MESEGIDITELIDKPDITKVKIAVTDIDGILRGKYINKNKFLSALSDGLGFCNVVLGWDMSDVCYDNTRYTGWHTGYPDAKVRLDLSTHRSIPWDNSTPFFLGDFEDELGNPLPVCPRQTLKRVLNRAKEMGFDPFLGLEFEWFNFLETPHSLREKKYKDLKPLTPGMFGYSILRSTLNQPFFVDLMDQLREFDIPLEGLHTETGPGVIEAAIVGASGIEAVDRAVLFKSAVKEIAYRHGIIATFMARWNTQMPGCGGHIHQSLNSLSNGQNVFHDANDERKMSATFKSYLAGQMKALPEVLPMFAPTINSYKRLVEGYWAPTTVTWSSDNRTVALRVIPGSVKSTRLETRVGGADINPYLAVAASIASGLDGIEKGLTLDAPPVVGNGYAVKDAVRLPRNLMEATDAFARSSSAKEWFGEAFVEHFAATREWEWRQYAQAVTDWELDRYLEII